MATNKKFSFDFDLTEASTSVGIPMAAELNAYASNLAKEVLLGIAQRQDKTETAMANQLRDGVFEDVIKLTNAVVDPAKLRLAGLEELDDAELKRLLESRRSDRSKAKKLGLDSSAQVLFRYYAAGIAEIIVRDALKLEYKPSNGTLSLNVEELANDQEALNKKIRSLQSKVSNLRREGKFAPEDWQGWNQLKEVQAQIAELQAHRVSTTTRSVRTIAEPTLEQVRESLRSMDAETLKQLLAEATQQVEA